MTDSTNSHDTETKMGVKKLSKTLVLKGKRFTRLTSVI